MSEPIFIGDNGIRRQATADEAAYILATQAELQAQLAAQEQAAADAQTAKQVARQAILDKLGLTAEEAQLLLGGI